MVTLEIRGILKDSFGNQIEFDKVLADYTYFKIGGKADIFFTPLNIVDLRKFMVMIEEYGIPFVVLGGGSNVLVSDTGFRGAVIYMRIIKNFSITSKSSIYSDAGAELRKLVNFAMEEGLTGFEFASGIPGTAGGALVCNAGGKYGSMKDIVEYADSITQSGVPKTFTKDELNLGYRECDIPANHVIVGLCIELKEDDRKAIRDRMTGILREKAKTQPLKSKSAGCIFKNPPGESAGEIIESLGLKGLQKGGALISEKHGNFIVNQGSANASDIHYLISQVKETVLKEKGYNLETEIRSIGC